jgi:REP element-mobilizing transposase RayT
VANIFCSLKSLGLNGAKITAVWDGSSSRRDRRTQPRVSTLGTEHPWRRAQSGRKIESVGNINVLCIDDMAQSLALVLVHIIFSTENRSPFLQSTEVRSQAHAYLTGTLRALDCIPLEVGGVADHVHILCGLSRKISLAVLVKNLKTSSSKIRKRQSPRWFQLAKRLRCVFC